MHRLETNPLNREVHDLKAEIDKIKSRLKLLERHRAEIEQVTAACPVSTVCTVGDRLCLWIDRTDLPKARAVLGRLKLVAKHASGPNQLAVFLDTEHPDIQLAYYRPAPDPARSRCKIMTEERVETRKTYSLVCSD